MPLTLLALGVALTGAVPDAIVRSVQDRLGDVQVLVVELASARLPEALPDVLAAKPAPGARLGRAIRFVLTSGGARVGTVVATLEVTGEVVVTRRGLARGEAIEAGAVGTSVVVLDDVLLERLPALGDVVGAEARRDIVAGEVLTQAVVVVPPTVRSGDEVEVLVRLGPVTATGPGRASGSGHVGDEIRVITPSSRKPRRARILGPASVEIVR